MAGSVNKVIVLGRLGANPELKYIPSGQAVCELRVATSESYKDRNEQQQEKTEWHRVQVWGKVAENCSKYLQKGQQVYLEGKLQTRTWDDKEGKKQYITEIVANNVVFLAKPGDGGHSGEDRSEGPSGGGYGGGRQQNLSGTTGRSARPAIPTPAPADTDFGADFGGSDDDIPF